MNSVTLIFPELYVWIMRKLNKRLFKIILILSFRNTGRLGCSCSENWEQIGSSEWTKSKGQNFLWATKAFYTPKLSPCFSECHIFNVASPQICLKCLQALELLIFTLKLWLTISCCFSSFSFCLLDAHKSEVPSRKAVRAKNWDEL